ncbi:hypothetical protein NQ314_013077 [Rhamnusium bicolor]|uniref:Uncharacterized protein n=1 Tax=Rhamnusium bicolor TaxID=1586634 RepID=A0AAV8X963_9CUCU|nr:hypothetical protein NQ314_013077 [Rhamnusium bicolor]
MLQRAFYLRRNSPPGSLPRVSQPNLGQYCFPIEYKDEEVPEKRPPDPVEPVVKEKMTHDAKAFWVVDPGKDDFFLHGVYRRYSKLEDRKSYDPRYHHKGEVVNECLINCLNLSTC